MLYSIFCLTQQQRKEQHKIGQAEEVEDRRVPENRDFALRFLPHFGPSLR